MRGGWLESSYQQTGCPSAQQNNSSQPERHPVNLERHPDCGLWKVRAGGFFLFRQIYFKSYCFCLFSADKKICMLLLSLYDPWETWAKKAWNLLLIFSYILEVYLAHVVFITYLSDMQKQGSIHRRWRWLSRSSSKFSGRALCSAGPVLELLCGWVSDTGWQQGWFSEPAKIGEFASSAKPRKNLKVHEEIPKWTFFNKGKE